MWACRSSGIAGIPAEFRNSEFPDMHHYSAKELKSIKPIAA